MTRDEWLLAGQFLLDAHGPFHFRAHEIANVGRTSNGAVLTAPPPDVALNAVQLIADVLEWVRGFEGEAIVDVNSWYRDPEYNRAIGGARRSVHMTGAAADINKRGWTPERLASAIHVAHPRSHTLGLGLYRNFVHVDIRGSLGRPAPARWSGTGIPDSWWRLST